jgi:hypothetical protein
MSEEDLVARIKECANDAKRRTGTIRKFPKLAGLHSLPEPATPQAVEMAESSMGLSLPPLLVRLWVEVANGGFGPATGLFGVNNEPTSPLSQSIPSVYLQLIADHSNRWKWSQKLVPVCDWGCGIHTVIDCATAEGLISHDSQSMRNHEGYTFARWMEDWANGVDLWERDFKRSADPGGTKA